MRAQTGRQMTVSDVRVYIRRDHHVALQSQTGDMFASSSLDTIMTDLRFSRFFPQPDTLCPPLANLDPSGLMMSKKPVRSHNILENFPHAQDFYFFLRKRIKRWCNPLRDLHAKKTQTELIMK